MSNKLKSILCGLITCSVMLVLANCAATKPGQGYASSTPPEIEELISKKYSESIHAVGSATGPKEDIAIRKATMQARAEIARKFKVQIDALQKSYEESVNSKAVDEYSQVIETFASLEISGSDPVKELVRSEKDGTYSTKVLVVVSAEKVKAIIDEKMNAYTSLKASEAYKELEARVEKEKQSQQE